MPIKCTNCEICGRQVPAERICTVVVEEKQLRKLCMCVCTECKVKFVESIDRTGLLQMRTSKG